MQIHDTTSHVDVSVAWGGFLAGLVLLATNLSPIFAVISFCVAIGFTLHKWIAFARDRRAKVNDNLPTA